MSAVQLDQLDHQLIEILAKDARVSNRKIAADLGVTEGTVRGRIKRLQQERLIAFTAITGFNLSNHTKLAFIGIQVEVENVRSIAEQISDIPLVSGVMIVMGRFNILAICLFDELEHLVGIASDQILALPGVHHVETSIAVRTIKYNTRIVRITEPRRPESKGQKDA
ncbi:MAG: Lrp/AsnC family transcriptional regulator [Sphingorhabdus sp.]